MRRGLMPSSRYSRAGVDQSAADSFVEWIAERAASPGAGVISGIGGFAGIQELPGTKGRKVLVGCTDGVGTKLKLACAMGRHDTVGIDLVAMNVNDLICTGARPLFFLDYLGVGRLDPEVTKQILDGIIAGCRQAGCVLLGGETAQLPDMYAPGEYDLAGFAVGFASRSELIGPGSARGARMRPGDVCLGLASSGVHSNGYTLVRKVLAESGRQLSERLPGLDGTLGEVLLRPTIIYERPLRKLLDHPKAGRAVRAVAHITGSGIPGNLPRVLGEGLAARLDRSSWPVPAVFGLIREWGGIGEGEMYDVFNMGIGLIVIVDRKAAEAAKALLGGNNVFAIGEIVEGPNAVIWKD
jgi:phosphoribosylformylglycinamidine cyclo-ligase